MPVPTTTDDFFDLVRRSQVLEAERLSTFITTVSSDTGLPRTNLNKLAALMVRSGLITCFQAEQFLLGKSGKFTIGRYRVLERLGSGGVSNVYLCEHLSMRNHVAIKVLCTDMAKDPAVLERFYREARAAASLHHPNIVQAFDIDEEAGLHYLVMDYVDGTPLSKIVRKRGKLDALRATHYIYQAALGLQHAHEAGLVHRDIKPANLLLERSGTVKILDMGLARFNFEDVETLTNRESVLGTADFLAPEQAIDSHNVDIRADIYSLGATFYFLLAGRPVFESGSFAQKLIWLQGRTPLSIRTTRPDVPVELADIIEKMMAKDPNDRFQVPAEVAAALEPFKRKPIRPPSAEEMPVLSIAAKGQSSHAPRQGSAPDIAVSEEQTSNPELSLPEAPTPVPERTLPEESSGRSSKSAKGKSARRKRQRTIGWVTFAIAALAAGGVIAYALMEFLRSLGE